MRRLTVQEQMLIFSILAILTVGACVRHCRHRIVPEVLPELPETALPYGNDARTGAGEETHEE